MTDCQFSIPFTVSTEEILAKAKAVIEKKEGRFTGDDHSGEFELAFLGMTAGGTYQVVGQELQVTILSKPFFIPCETVENYLKSKLT